MNKKPVLNYVVFNNRYLGTIESEKYNLFFNNIRYLLESINKDLADEMKATINEIEDGADTINQDLQTLYDLIYRLNAHREV